MRLAGDSVRKLATEKGMSLGALLRKAGVSRTAYYSLLRKDSILQASLEAIARELNVSPLAFLEDPAEIERKARERIDRLQQILSRHKGLNRENVWHTLILLEKEPIERLRRGLLRAQGIHIHRPRTRVPARTR